VARKDKLADNDTGLKTTSAVALAKAVQALIKGALPEYNTPGNLQNASVGCFFVFMDW